MELVMHAKGVRLTEGLKTFIQKKLRSALGRFGDRVRSVRVQLTDINGPRGGEDIHCHILAHFGRGGPVNVKETRGDPYAAIARASARAGQHLSRRMSRRRTGRRGR